MTYELWIPQKQASNMQQQHKAAQLQKKKKQLENQNKINK